MHASQLLSFQIIMFANCASQLLFFFQDMFHDCCCCIANTIKSYLFAQRFEGLAFWSFVLFAQSGYLSNWANLTEANHASCLPNTVSKETGKRSDGGKTIANGCLTETSHGGKTIHWRHPNKAGNTLGSRQSIACPTIETIAAEAAVNQPLSTSYSALLTVCQQIQQVGPCRGTSTR